jgi:hypothetical protein
MGKVFLRILVCAVLVPVTGCDIDRMNRLEKQNEELKAEISKSRAVADFDLHGRCAKDARSWLSENWSRDKDTILLDYTNHYNKKTNQCFILVEYHYSLDKSGSWVNDMTLFDVYENVRYAGVNKNTMIYLKPTYRSEEFVYGCEVGDKKCKTVEEFNNLVSPYMND